MSETMKAAALSAAATLLLRPENSHHFSKSRTGGATNSSMNDQAIAVAALYRAILQQLSKPTKSAG